MEIRALKTISPKAKRIALGVALASVVIAGTGIGLRLSNATATPPAQSADASAPGSANAAAPATTAPNPHPGPMPTTVEITFTTYPSGYATVTWGKTVLGRIKPHEPLVIVRPRDSGPLDVIVRSPGYLPVHTRAHTFEDAKIGVKLTRPDQKSTLFGYRAPIDAGPPDTGVPPGAAAPVAPVEMPQVPQ